MYSWWWVRLSPETCRVKPLRRIKTQLLHLVGIISILYWICQLIYYTVTWLPCELEFVSWFTTLSRDYLANLNLSVDLLHCHVTTLRTSICQVAHFNFTRLLLRTCNLSFGSLHFHVTILRTCNFSVGSVHFHVTNLHTWICQLVHFTFTWLTCALEFVRWLT